MSSPSRYLVSAPGKVILFGEHAVVYGKTAIAGSLDGLRTYVFFEKRDDGFLELNLPKLGLQHPLLWPISALPYSKVTTVSKGNNSLQESTINEELLKSLKEIVLDGNAGNKNNQEINELQQVAASVFLYLYASLEDKQTSWCGTTVHIASNLPVGAGLGSSAAYSVCLATGLLLVLGHITIPNYGEKVGGFNISDSSSPMNLINRWAFQAEKIIHGTPSGIDNAVATYGGAVSFSKGVMENVIEFQSLRFLLTNTKVPRNTRTLVANVRKLHDKCPHIVVPILEAIEGISSKFKEIINSGDSQKELNQNIEAIELIDFNHYLLNSLRVGHPSIDKVREIAAQYSLHSKLTGAGGGGCVLTLLRDDVPNDDIMKIMLNLTSIGFECFETKVGGHGISILDASTISKQEFLTSENIQQFSGWKHFN
ncbi:mevalonate kinase [Rhizophagus irregularis]|uniref:Mevalonate kinase n=1 Tax=Rhizophagus irregularis TaxID=588596 RepID=A0A2I1EP59_9GLOM|nr:mevalonate kinase [Rhizophagus irregularis]PKC63067.1 mevalonate kinase [Rhizophagus irregularis]PKY23913.1 mevalonate kinase [Rhizophagus irregularis]